MRRACGQMATYGERLADYLAARLHELRDLNHTSLAPR